MEQRRELDRLRLVIEEREDESKRILAVIGVRDSNIVVMKEEISRLQEYEQSLIDELRNIREVFADRVEVIASKSASLIEKDQRVQFLENAIEDLARHNLSLESGIKDCRRHIDTQTSELEKVAAESFERASLINQLNDYIENSEVRMQAQSNEIMKYSVEVSEYVSLINNLSEKIAEHEASMRMQAVEIERVVAESSKRGLLIDSLYSKLEKSEAMNTECSEKLVSTETELVRIQKFVDSLRMTLLGRFLLRRMKYDSTTTESH
jgi:chromosome segregation ATPase